MIALASLPNVQKIANAEVLVAAIVALTPSSAYGAELRRDLRRLLDEYIDLLAAHRAASPALTDTQQERVAELLGPSPLDALRSAFIAGMDKGRETREAYGEWQEITSGASTRKRDTSGISATGCSTSWRVPEQETPQTPTFTIHWAIPRADLATMTGEDVDEGFREMRRQLNQERQREKDTARQGSHPEAKP